MRRLILLGIVVFITLGCAGNRKTQQVEFEGLHDGKVRVLVRVPVLTGDTACESAACREKLINSARERSTLLLRSMIQQKITGKVEKGRMIHVHDSIHSPRIIKVSCSELSCNALVDFKIKDELAGTLSESSGLPGKTETRDEK